MWRSRGWDVSIGNSLALLMQFKKFCFNSSPVLHVFLLFSQVTCNICTASGGGTVRRAERHQTQQHTKMQLKAHGRTEDAWEIMVNEGSLWHKRRRYTVLRWYFQSKRDAHREWSANPQRRGVGDFDSPYPACLLWQPEGWEAHALLRALFQRSAEEQKATERGTRPPQTWTAEDAVTQVQQVSLRN